MFHESFHKLPFEFLSGSEESTFELAKGFANVLKAGSFVALFGNLGAGKTLFVKGLCEGLGVLDDVTSPTFSLVNEYSIGGSSKIKVVHFDMYRIYDETDLETIGYFDYLNSEDIIMVVEWSEHIINFLPKGCYCVNFSFVNNDKRFIRIKQGV